MQAHPEQITFNSPLPNACRIDPELVPAIRSLLDHGVRIPCWYLYSPLGPTPRNHAKCCSIVRANPSTPNVLLVSHWSRQRPVAVKISRLWVTQSVYDYIANTFPCEIDANQAARTMSGLVWQTARIGISAPTQNNVCKRRPCL